MAEGLGHDWKKLAVELNFSDDVIAECDCEGHDVTQKASKMLTLWFVSISKWWLQLFSICEELATMLTVTWRASQHSLL